ncbi:MAG TPA: hypothetical protein VHO71_03300 [Caproiciproducens sp.]|nr:hypothetical protein [Caproiciproducens sp.]
MKKLKSIVSSVTAIAMISTLAITTSPAFAANTTQPYVQSDTTVNFTVEHNTTYKFKMTVHGSRSNPKIASGNRNVLRTENTTHTKDNSGNDVYYFTVRAIGKAGQASGVYTTLPGQKAVRHSIIAVPYSEGKYKVGVDIPAGEYVIFPDKSESGEYFGYFSLSKDSAGTSPVTNDAYTSRRYLTVSDGQYLMLNESEMVAFKDTGRMIIKNNSLDAGMYKCGFDIQPGKYKIISTDTQKAYMELRSGDSGNSDELISNDNFLGTKYITVSAGQYLLVDRGKLDLN